MAVYRNQVSTIESKNNEQFHNDVLRGLSSSPKFLPSKYFYDAEGDAIFQQIMKLPEYYLTRSEQEIFLMQTKAMGSLFLKKFQEFDIIELGAGDATKSTHLLRYLFESGINFTYYPVDISENVIQLLEAEIPKRIPGLQVEGLLGDYFEMIKKSYEVSEKRKIVLFLGSNIGNFKIEEVKRFLSSLTQQLVTGDLVLIGFDLKKNPKQILAAYNDRLGVTKAFNLNLLRRINNELDGDFDISRFEHYPTYDPNSGACKSYLISLEDQEVHIGEETIQFYRNEPIWTELSQKYSEQEISQLAADSGFKPISGFYDCRHWFLDAVWEKL
ncbi:MAG: L-histidine N(alpha)-methyltransferase [Bacteroidota bacterium]|nr:L-histidine N(alpha)-methyltransferase [Bacteroidota bacterium]